jgi:hypothetical protein
MALKKTLTTPCGFTATGAYHRVEGVSLQAKDIIVFKVRSYKNDSGVPHFSDVEHTCAYDLSGSNPIAQAYEYLKTLSDFADAEDC